MSKIIKKKLKIEGMYCTACALNIDFDLEDLDGVNTAKTNYAREELEVEFNPQKVTEEKIIKTVKLSGYTAKL